MEDSSKMEIKGETEMEKKYLKIITEFMANTSVQSWNFSASLSKEERYITNGDFLYSFPRVKQNLTVYN